MASRKLQESKGKYSLFIPGPIVEGIGWRKGDRISIDIAGANKLTLSRVEED